MTIIKKKGFCVGYRFSVLKISICTFWVAYCSQWIKVKLGKVLTWHGKTKSPQLIFYLPTLALIMAHSCCFTVSISSCMSTDAFPSSVPLFFTIICVDNHCIKASAAHPKISAWRWGLNSLEHVPCVRMMSNVLGICLC